MAWSTNSKASNFSNDETILRESQGVIFRKPDGARVEGTLVLTNKRLLFVVGDNYLDYKGGGRGSFEMGASYSKVQNLKDIRDDPNNYSIPLRSIISTEGRRGMFRPALKVQAYDSFGQSVTSEFVAKFRSSSEENNVDGWAKIISDPNRGKVAPEHTEASTSAQLSDASDNLQDRVLGILGDMQWKGLFMIQDELKEAYEEKFDSDAIDATCQDLVRKGSLEQDETGEFFRKRPSVM